MFDNPIRENINKFLMIDVLDEKHCDPKITFKHLGKLILSDEFKCRSAETSRTTYGEAEIQENREVIEVLSDEISETPEAVEEVQSINNKSFLFGDFDHVYSIEQTKELVTDPLAFLKQQLDPDSLRMHLLLTMKN
eukprot:CAMPEP_0204898496 /NCGR_PEP_ID=MMETSP1397-20131031/1328_1 /ASSEMBLY_ACC=CAM_ASM_000891 /TAXON_ID=49980 /ORGANISM="Climacostomum Climacostomum virens, Strain Stock W-24" /LENGTH=135 /DNA_ID=CAMNT_0052066357 /DNA_START=1270 /DNA_END=1677 /DNA_ORIENTATION=+